MLLEFPWILPAFAEVTAERRGNADRWDAPLWVLSESKHAGNSSMLRRSEADICMKTSILFFRTTAAFGEVSLEENLAGSPTIRNAERGKEGKNL